MAKREWTDEQRKAFGEKMKRARQNKNTQNENEEPVTEPQGPGPVAVAPIPTVEDVQEPVEPEPKTTIDSADYDKLRAEIMELKAMMFDGMMKNQGQPDAQGAQVSNGKLVGTTDKYSVKENYYPDPRDRLKQEDKLKRFAFDMNYDLNYAVSDVTYTTIDNIRYREPRFTLELVRIILDEETGEQTGGRYVVCNLMMHEDPDAAISIARQEGIEVDETNERRFLDEMRYIRFRDWLLECFYPPKPAPASQRKDMVIGGKLVQYYEVNQEEGGASPRFDFTKINKKL